VKMMSTILLLALILTWIWILIKSGWSSRNKFLKKILNWNHLAGAFIMQSTRILLLKKIFLKTQKITRSSMKYSNKCILLLRINQKIMTLWFFKTWKTKRNSFYLLMKKLRVYHKKSFYRKRNLMSKITIAAK
jgi:hypothetical protein